MSATQSDSRREYVRKLKELDLNDPEFENKFNNINKTYNSNSEVSTTRSDHRAYAQHHLVDDFMLSPFRSLSRMHNNLYKMMNINNFFNDFNDFINDDEFNEAKLDKLDINTYDDASVSENSVKKDKDKPQSYYKYVSSMTTYDNNGVRKAKSIARTEKYDGKEKKVKQVSKFQDGDKYVEEYLNPDGTTRRIEKKIDSTKMLE